MSNQTVMIKVEMDSSGVVTGGRVISRALSQTKQGVDSISRSLDGAKKLLVGFFSVQAGMRAAQQLAQIADQYANLGTRLALATNGSVSFAEAQQRVFTVAQRTSTSLADTADLVEKLTTSFRSMGGEAKASFDVAVELSKTINQAIALSGASQAQAQTAATILTTALTKGGLAARDFNTLLKQTPALAQAIAAGMGTTIDKLVQKGDQGVISIKQVVQALAKSASDVDRDYTKLPLTIGRAWTQLTNAVQSYVGKADQAGGYSAKLANAIATVASHIDDVVRAVVTLGEIVATVYAGKIIRSGLEWIANLRLQTAAVAANGVAVTGWAATTAASFGAAKKAIGLLGIAFNVLGAAIVGWQIGTYLQNQFQIVREAGALLVTTLATAWEYLKYGFKVAWLAMKDAAIGVINTIREHIANVLEAMANVDRALPGSLGTAAAAKLDTWVAKIRPATSAAADFKTQLAALNSEHEKAVVDISDMMASMMESAKASQTASSATDQAKESSDKFDKQLQALLASLKNVNKTTDDNAASMSKYRVAMDEARAAIADAVSQFNKPMLSPVQQAWSDYEDALRKVAQAAGKQIELAKQQAAAGDKTVDVAKVEAQAYQQVRDAIDAMAPALQRNIQLAREKMDVAGQMIRQMQQETMLAGLSERDAAIMRAGLELENQLRQDNLGLTQQQIDLQKQQVMTAAAAAYDEQKSLEARKQALQDFVGYWRNALDSTSKAFADLLTGGIQKFSDFGHTLKDIARQFVADIIAQFLRMRVLGPIFNSILGSVGGWFGMGGGSLGGTVLGIAGNYYGGGGTISSQGGVGGGAGGGGGIMDYLQTGSTLYKGYQYLTGGSAATGGAATGGYDVFGLNGGGSFNSLTGTGMYAGPGAIANPGYYGGGVGPWGGVANIGSYAVPYASIGGGVLGAYYGYNHAGGGVGGVAAGVSYGALGAGIAGTAAGVAGGASLGAAAGGAFGAAAGASWIPVVGWILAALAVIDLASGGKLFGTGYKPTAAETSLSIGPDGGSAAMQYTQVKQKALFGGHQWKTTAVAPTQEVLDAANALYDSVRKSMVQGAQQLAIDVPQMITASLKTQMTLDKHGNVTGTKYVVDYLGRTWEEATADAAAQRIGAEAIIATVAASAGQVAEQLAEQWRGNAETLLDGAQMMLAAQADINKGNALLALGANQTLAGVTQLVKQMQTDGETLAQTYARLAAANKQYLDFVAQFNDQIQGAGLAVSLAQIAQQMQANIDQANALAQAAGLQGARESDLANIHKVAAQQAADAMRQFAAAADQLVTKLYGGSGHTLAAVLQQIDTLANKLKPSVDLALGDLSPLTDQEKLDLALKGLRSGTTSADQVLSLGRKLYATGSDYTGLYNKVQEILGQPSAATAAGKDQINSGLDQLNGLVQQRDHLTDLANQAQRISDAQTLAGYVADLSTVSGQTFQQVADSLGFSLGDLGKDLGVQDMGAYLGNLADQDIPGSLGRASNEIVTAIQAIGRDIVQAIAGGPLTDKGPTGGMRATGTQVDDTVSILQSIDTRLGNIETHTGDTAGTNRQMTQQGNLDNLRVNQGGARNVRGVAAL